MWLDVLMTMILEMKDSCDMTPCSLEVGYYHFEGTYCFGRTDGAEVTMVTCIKFYIHCSVHQMYQIIWPHITGRRVVWFTTTSKERTVSGEKMKQRRFLRNHGNMYQITRPHITGRRVVGSRVLPLRRNVLFREDRRSRSSSDGNMYQIIRSRITGRRVFWWSVTTTSKERTVSG